MSFLKKLGQVLATVGATALGVGPLVAPLLGSKGNQVSAGISTAINDLTAISTVVIQIETALQGQAGADKFKAAVALVGPIIKTSQIVSGKKIADPALLDKGIQEVTQGVVDVLNSLDADSVSSEVHS
jgi:phage-related tail protein